VLLAASWTANFASWSAFANWANNSNIASLVMGIVIPGIFIYGFVHYEHRKTRRHITAHHEALHARLDGIEEHLGMERRDGSSGPPPK
jgi:hypothetical protein